MNIHWLGTNCPYEDVLSRQIECGQRHINDTDLTPDIFLLEHAPIYTMGRTRDQSSLRNKEQLPYPVCEINRGGQATYHGPGQLVIYPILHLQNFHKDIHAYITILEETLIETCAAYQVSAQQKEGLTGVWVQHKKIASIGVGVKSWVTMHGLAINLTRQSLRGFTHITPCGIDHVSMTCLENELPEGVILPDAESFGRLWVSYFERRIHPRPK